MQKKTQSIQITEESSENMEIINNKIVLEEEKEVDQELIKKKIKGFIII